jgi:hypothetical protein
MSCSLQTFVTSHDVPSECISAIRGLECALILLVRVSGEGQLAVARPGGGCAIAVLCPLDKHHVVTKKHADAF